MKDKKYYIKDNFYFDFDQNNQLRIAGPGNHLFLGWTFPDDIKPVLHGYDIVENQLCIKLTFPSSFLSTYLPIVTDIRSIRAATERTHPQVTFADLIEAGRNEFLPEKKDIEVNDNQTSVTFVNSYIDIHNKLSEYGVKIKFINEVEAKLNEKIFEVSTLNTEIILEIYTVSNIESPSSISSLFVSKEPLSQNLFSEFLLTLYDESAEYIEHLVKYNKTSSFEYGTIFPRDWMESADLGNEDLTKETIDYIYEKVLENVTEEGEGWHENIIGQYKNKVADKDSIDRRMIDIEPHYILGLKYVSPHFLLDSNNVTNMKNVARYIVKKAMEFEILSFKRTQDDYNSVGNWRDSIMAYPNRHSPLSPYDVNCIFYPQALKIIREYNGLFKFEGKLLDDLIVKWGRQKDKYRMYHPYNIIGYCIALHGSKNKPLPIAHLDESYDLFYGEPALDDVYSFSKKILNSNYFYTPVGPMLVASDEDEFSTFQYHGKVIWPKQAAFSIAGLTRQYKIGLTQSWPKEVLDLIREAVIKTSQACFRGWEEMGFVPELYYYDDKLDRARLYTDQDEYEAQMSNIQLWSSVAVRRIMTDYNFIMN